MTDQEHHSPPSSPTPSSPAPSSPLCSFACPPPRPPALAALPRCLRTSLPVLLASFLVVQAVSVVSVVSAASAQTQGDTKSSETESEQSSETLLLRTRAGTLHKFSVELAVSPAEQSRGLMFRTRLAAKHGMLFLHSPPQRVVMWMKNTYLPLDMLFLDREGKVVQIVERTTPLSLTRIRSTQAISAVLELSANSVSRFELATGDRAEHPFFQR